MKLVIVESPFSGGGKIDISVHPHAREAYKGVPVVARCGKYHTRTSDSDTDVAVKLAKRELCIKYARAAMRDCLISGEAPYASHLLYTQHGVLDDDNQEERALAIEAGLQWGAVAYKTVVYTDLGISEGMRQGIERAKCESRKVEYRTLPGWS